MKKTLILLALTTCCKLFTQAQSAKNILTGELGFWKYKQNEYTLSERHENAATAYYHMLTPNFGLGLRIGIVRGSGNPVWSAMRLSTDLVARWRLTQMNRFRWINETGFSRLEEATYFYRNGVMECGLGLSEEYMRRLSSTKKWFHDATFFGLAFTNRLEYRMFYDNWIGLTLSNNTYWREKKMKMFFVPSVAVLHGF